MTELGDLSQGCGSVGDRYNPFNKTHGSVAWEYIIADENGVAEFSFNEKSI